MRKSIAFLFLLLAISCCLRLYGLGKYTLWYDEATVVVDDRGFDQLHPLAKLFDQHFVVRNHDYLTLYSHGFMYYWMKLFGKTEFVLRLSSVLFSVLGIFLLYLIGKEILDLNTASLASLLLAISPLHIYYAQELRQYAAISFFTLICIFAILRIIKNNKVIYWVIYVVFNILNVYFHYITLLTLLSFIIFFIIKIKKYRYMLRELILAHGTIFILLLPVFLVVYPNMIFGLSNKGLSEFSDFPIWAGKIGLKNIIFTLKNFSVGYNMDFYSFAGVSLSCVYFVFFLAGVYRFRKYVGMQLIALCLFIPVLSLFLISQIRPSYVDRYFFNLLPLYLLIVAGGISKISKQALIISIICFGGFFALKNYYLNYLPGDYSQHVGVLKQDIRGIVDVVVNNYQKGDKIIHTCRNTVFPFKFYFERLSVDKELIQEVDKGRVAFFIPANDDLFIFEYSKRHPVTFLSNDYYHFDGIKAGGRVWLVFSSFLFQGLNTKEYDVVKYMQHNFLQTKLQESEGVFLYLFRK